MTAPALHAIAPQRPSMALYVLIAVAVTVVVGALVGWLSHEYAATDALQLRAQKAFERRVESATLIARIGDAEAAQRGFVVTGDPQFLAAYGPARDNVLRSIAQLHDAVHDEPVPARLLERMRRLVLIKFAEMDEIIALRRTEGFDAAARDVQVAHGRHLMDDMRAISAQIVGRAEIDRNASTRLYSARVDADQWGIWFAIAGGGILLLIAALLLWRQSSARYRARLAAYSIAERNRAILDSTIDAIAILNPSGTIETINAAGQKMLGYRQEELERRYISTLIRLVDRPVTFHERIGLKDGRLANPYLPDRNILHRDGHEIPVDIALGVMRLPDGDHIVASVRDIAERKRIERAKDDLMSTVSHELRTPLTSVVGALGLLRAGSGGELPAGAARLIEIAENNSRRLIRLINDMLDIDRIQSGALNLARAPIDLRDVLAQTCEGSRGLAEAAGVHIVCDLPDAPVTVSGDGDRLLQVVTNLTSNAVRASPPGGTITIGLDTATTGRVIVTVDDEGPGVPAEFRRRIFGRFERATDDQGAGTGLGLAISKEIVGRHDGTIWFEDRPGGGSRFAFMLDLLRVPEDAQQTGDGPEILIVEDDAEMAATLRRMVNALGHRAHCVGSAEEARAALSGGVYLALLLDIKLPDESGINIAKWVRASKGQSTLPIIVVSALARGETVKSMPADIIDWLSKPVDPSRLSAAVTEAVARSGMAQPTVLHLDDDPDMLDIVASVLSAEARVLRARTLADARDILETGTPDVAILDLHLADGSGLDLLPMLTDPKGRAVSTVIFSAHEVGAVHAAQVNAVLIKSRGSLPDLKATVRRLAKERSVS